MKRKILVTLSACLLICTMVVGGTLAYFTDVTEEKQNVFTVGGVDIDLTETEWNEKDSHNIAPGVDFDKNPTITVDKKSDDCWVFLEMDLNKYVSLINLMGVDAYLDDTNFEDLSGKYPGFVTFVNELATNNVLREKVVNKWFTGIEHSKWEIMNLDEIKGMLNDIPGKNNPKQLSIILGYKNVLKANESVTFMTKFGMPETVTQSMMDGDDAYKIGDVSKSDFNTDSANFKITFTAYAVQAAEMDNLAEAYNNMPRK